MICWYCGHQRYEGDSCCRTCGEGRSVILWEKAIPVFVVLVVYSVILFQILDMTGYKGKSTTSISPFVRAFVQGLTPAVIQELAIQGALFLIISVAIVLVFHRRPEELYRPSDPNRPPVMVAGDSSGSDHSIITLCGMLIPLLAHLIANFEPTVRLIRHLVNRFGGIDRQSIMKFLPGLALLFGILLFLTIKSVKSGRLSARMQFRILDHGLEFKVGRTIVPIAWNDMREGNLDHAMIVLNTSWRRLSLFVDQILLTPLPPRTPFRFSLKFLRREEQDSEKPGHLLIKALEKHVPHQWVRNPLAGSSKTFYQFLLIPLLFLVPLVLLTFFHPGDSPRGMVGLLMTIAGGGCLIYMLVLIRRRQLAEYKKQLETHGSIVEVGKASAGGSPAESFAWTKTEIGLAILGLGLCAGSFYIDLGKSGPLTWFGIVVIAVPIVILLLSSLFRKKKESVKGNESETRS